MLENAISRYVATGEVPGKLGSRHPSIAPFAAFATKDGHIALAAGNDDLFARVARVLGREELVADPRFATNPERVRHVELLTAEMESRCSRRVRRKSGSRCSTAHSVPSGPLNDVAAVMADPQVLARNMIVESPRPRPRPHPHAGQPDQAVRARRPENAAGGAGTGWRQGRDIARAGTVAKLESPSCA